eukprot:scaffold3819_cov107-Isochrysis_galbana.AAC.6
MRPPRPTDAPCSVSSLRPANATCSVRPAVWWKRRRSLTSMARVTRALWPRHSSRTASASTCRTWTGA